MFELHQGDCLAVLKTMPDSSVDAVVTDPPYGLSNKTIKSLSDRLCGVFLDVVLPNLYDANVSAGRLAEFVGPLGSVTFLDWMNRAVGEETPIAVPISAVDFKRNAIANQEIENATESPKGGSDCVLPDVLNSDSVQLQSDYILQLRSPANPSGGNGQGRFFRELGSGRFGVLVVIPRNSCFARFLGSVKPCSPSFIADVVGLCDDAQTFPAGASSVMTGGRAEVMAVLSFDVRNGFVELLPATSANEFDAVFKIGRAEPVRAVSGASGLPSKFEPCRVSFVGDSTNRALTFYFHNEFLSELDYNQKGFMGKSWDGDVPSQEIWAECLRVLKPGGHLLSFAGTRTQHRMAVRIEDAGFEIRDMIAWVYGSGFPKSHNGEWGGTALKPALEPITMARKPIDGTVEANWREHGTGALNIDGCRVGTEQTITCAKTQMYGTSSRKKDQEQGFRPRRYDNREQEKKVNPPGRWPANLIHDGSDEVVGLFPADKQGSAARFFYCAKASKRDRDEGLEGFSLQAPIHGRADQTGNNKSLHVSNSKEPRANIHPTVKPTDLMRYLCRLVTPPGGVVLDPFMGSGSTGKAAILEGFNFIGIEREPEYLEIARARIENAKGKQGSLL